ncbi:L,D-transpeptidase catalytic domain-containing protein [Bifidobacterium margollesii]|uniref:L,D-transpeptidase catalytic domain-containing protein n=1 Tax=Bifidobacterium margollesii TaxID=2020964 RepID=A0A2N5J970_9BIFI|nr:L,D-transpeptidase [Bifidobacterium margollesii]PLS30745.1 L,D-transpeptidase catalytic domain-containing protein [Bifidobacterium margollesii]
MDQNNSYNANFAADNAETIAMAPLNMEAMPEQQGNHRHTAKRKPVALIVALSLLALVIVLFAGYVIGGQYYFKDKAAPGVTFGGTSVAGQTADELKATVNDAVAASAVQVSLKGGDATKASLKDLGVTVDVNKTVNDLLNAKKDNVFAKVNPFQKTSVPMTTSTDKLAMSTYLSDTLIGEDARVVNASVRYDTASNQFTVSASRSGESPKLDTVASRVAEISANPGTTLRAVVETQTENAPISDETAGTTATEANKRLASQIVISNGDTKQFTIPSSEIAKWIKVNGDPSKGTLSLSYDENAINSYLSGTLAKELNQKSVAEQNVVNSQGTVLAVEVEGVNGVEVASDTSNTATQVVEALKNGASSEIKADAKITKYETKSRTVRYDIPNGDPHAVINLSEQKVYAYKGTTLVNTFLMSSGKPSTPTDTGTYYVHTKYTSQTMRGEDYVTPNVPWVTYYNGGEGFHGAPWNTDGIAKGEPRSHGCTNMNVGDAKWIYDFLPLGAQVQVVGGTPSSAVRG